MPPIHNFVRVHFTRFKAFPTFRLVFRLCRLVPGCDRLQRIESAAFFLQDDLGRFRPHERLRIGVVVQEIVVDRGFQLCHAGEGTAPDALAGDLGEEALDEVQPGGARRREVQLEALMFREPRLDLVRLVGRGVVEHDVTSRCFATIRSIRLRKAMNSRAR